ncbi:trypsin-like peptidase domain-containing protein [Paraburkholderia azotifigens]|uniref:trypsin-like peptidase domain-containing protein n=1 Tax=Paraburkholderia azotifigens TaxID=2057004 RepID=UPI00317D7860
MILRIVALAIFTGFASLPPAAMAADGAPSPLGQSDPARLDLDESEPDGFPGIADRYGAAVVNITARSEPKLPAVEPLDPADPLVSRFNSLSLAEQRTTGGAPAVMTGAGSGFIVSAEGLVLTTAHVVDHADDVTLTLTDRRVFKAKVLSIDAATDVAILKIDAAQLPVVKLGAASHIRIGEPVLAIGTTAAGGNIVTMGIVSAAQSTLPDGRRFAFFQTGVPANPDNSGGPLFNQAGQVVGIDVQVHPGGDRYGEMTFAIPIDAANELLKTLQRREERPIRLTHDSLGLVVQDVSVGVAAALELPGASGVLVNTVKPGSASAVAGIRPGDVIVQVGGGATGTSAAFSEAVAKLRPGTTTSVQLVRARQSVSVAVTVLDAGDAGSRQPGTDDGVDRLGLVSHALGVSEKRSAGARVLHPIPLAKEAREPAARLDQYQVAVAQRIEANNPSDVLHGNPQAMLRSVVVISFVVDRSGLVLTSSVYRTNGDSEAENTALASLRRSSPLPQPPAELLDGSGQLELFEDWLFNDDRKFQLRELTPPQAQTLN